MKHWLLGFKYLFFTGLVLVGALFGGGLSSVPFILAAEVLGYHPDENRWILVGVFVVTPYLIGGSFPVLLKFLAEEVAE